MIKRVFRFDLMQRCWGRKWLKGKFYRIDPVGLSMGTFWSDKIITSCQSKIIDTEEY
jgi:hypothetical protein